MRKEPATEADRIRAVRALARASSVLERASSELSLAHYRVLAAISSGSAMASRIADRLAVGKPTISAAVEALERRGGLGRPARAGGPAGGAPRPGPPARAARHPGAARSGPPR